MRVASIDIGSYSVRLTIAEVSNGLKILLERGAITALGKGVNEDGYLSNESMEETLKTLIEYKHIIDNYGVDHIIAVGTEALRVARNSGSFIDMVKKETGIEINIISSEEEGKYSYISAVYSLELKGNILVVDQGGSSTEFIYGKDTNIEKIISLKMGIVNLTERFINSDPPSKRELKKMQDFILNKLSGLHFQINDLIGLGGTITTLSALEYNVFPYDSRKIHGTILSLDSIRGWFERLVSMTVEERKKIPAIEDRRAEAIIAGILMFMCILEYFNLNTIRVSDWGLKQGIIISKFLCKN